MGKTQARISLLVSFGSELSRQARKQRQIQRGLLILPLGEALILAHSSYPSPFFCPFLALTGIPCPGCGLSRSFTAIALGQWETAINYHLFGPVIFLCIIIAIVHLSLELLTKCEIQTFYLTGFHNPKLSIFSTLVIWGYHLTRLVALNQSGELALNFYQSPLGSRLLFDFN
jgi:hypothetical protein